MHDHSHHVARVAYLNDIAGGLRKGSIEHGPEDSTPSGQEEAAGGNQTSIRGPERHVGQIWIRYGLSHIINQQLSHTNLASVAMASISLSRGAAHRVEVRSLAPGYERACTDIV
eukprot:scaffold77905_cov58-Attheya_sp.AAC.5